jgi:hypothetical protein
MQGKDVTQRGDFAEIGVLAKGCCVVATHHSSRFRTCSHELRADLLHVILALVCTGMLVPVATM